MTDISALTDEELLKLYIRVADAKRYIPHKPHPKQLEFLRLDTKEAMYGGAAGGGKSDALLMAALMYIDKPGYAALILRRTTTDANLKGGIMARAEEWLASTDAVFETKENRWTVPGGGSLTFGFLQHESDKYRYQGSEFDFIAFDELTQFERSQYLYLMTRLRKVKTKLHNVPLRMRSATNPGGIGHDWVYERFVNPATRKPGIRFIQAFVDDNPSLDAADYHETLSELDSETRDQLQKGVWVKSGVGIIYKQFSDKNVLNELPSLPLGHSWRYVLAVDLGSSETEETTAFVVLAHDPMVDVAYVLGSYREKGLTTGSTAEEIVALSKRYGTFDRIIVDQGGLGRSYIKEFNERYGIFAKGAEKEKKLTFRRYMNGAFERSRLMVLRDGNEELIEELGRLAWNRKGTDAQAGMPDHLTDALLYGWREVRSHVTDDDDSPGDLAEAAKRLEDAWIEAECEQERRAQEGPWFDLL